MKKNPYALNFGHFPNKYIHRNLLVGDIVESLEDNLDDDSVFFLSGAKGMGKSVLIQAIEEIVSHDEDWVAVSINKQRDMAVSLAASLYEREPNITVFVDSKLNLSRFGIGKNVSKINPVATIHYALKRICNELEKRGQRLVVLIDDIDKSDAVVDFLSEVEDLADDGLRLNLIVTGTKENLDSVKTDIDTKLFNRIIEYEITPLNRELVTMDYANSLEVSPEVAYELAKLTKGYSFAYQVLGKYMLELDIKEITPELLILFDEALSEKVYIKLWNDLAPKDKLFLRVIAEYDEIDASELLELTNKKHNEWSEPRKRLSDKGIIDAKNRGHISMRLPRFNQFIKNVVDN